MVRSTLATNINTHNVGARRICKKKFTSIREECSVQEVIKTLQTAWLPHSSASTVLCWQSWRFRRGCFQKDPQGYCYSVLCTMFHWCHWVCGSFCCDWSNWHPGGVSCMSVGRKIYVIPKPDKKANMPLLLLPTKFMTLLPPLPTPPTYHPPALTVLCYKPCIIYTYLLSVCHYCGQPPLGYQVSNEAGLVWVLYSRATGEIAAQPTAI